VNADDGEMTSTASVGSSVCRQVAAIQHVYRVSNSESVRVHHCSSHGYDFVAPRNHFAVRRGSIDNNNGYAVGVLVLNGESSNQPESQFVPLSLSTAPFNVYGLLRMCTVQTLVYVRDRALLYHKYTFDTLDCIKVVRSREPHKQIALRFLQVHVYNDTFYKSVSLSLSLSLSVCVCVCLSLARLLAPSHA